MKSLAGPINMIYKKILFVVVNMLKPNLKIIMIFFMTQQHWFSSKSTSVIPDKRKLEVTANLS